MPPQTVARPLGSKKQRPCDYCRRQKHSCHIINPGQPCTDCAARNKRCTFSAPAMKRKPKLEGKEPAPGRVNIATSDLLSTNSVTPITSLSSLVKSMRAKRAPLHVDYDDEESDGAYHDSLDLGIDNCEESHFVGPMAVTGDALSIFRTFSFPGEFRQVSDGPLPATFMRNPALLYGRLAHEGITTQDCLTSCIQQFGSVVTEELIQQFKTTTLPAFPIIDRLRLEAALRHEPGVGRFPTSLLACIIAHAAHTYRFQDRSGLRNLWNQILLAIDGDYRLPCLQILQTTIVVLLCCPHTNHGQNNISIARAVGCAQLLGLHVDCAKWRLPRWEKNVRRRLWWTLIILDTWRSYVDGRPSFIHHSIHNVEIPKSTQSQDGFGGEDDEALSMLSFIAMSKLSIILQQIIEGFHTLQAVTTPPEGAIRLEMLEDISQKLDNFHANLHPALQTPVVRGLTSRATGVGSMQAAYLSLRITVIRLSWGPNDSPWPFPQELGIQAATQVCSDFLAFLEALESADYSAYWFPYTCYCILNAAALLIRLSIRSSDSVNMLQQLAKVIRSGDKAAWSPAVSSRQHLETLFRHVGTEVPFSEAILSVLTEASPEDPLQTSNFNFDFDSLFSSMTNEQETLWNSLDWMLTSSQDAFQT